MTVGEWANRYSLRPKKSVDSDIREWANGRDFYTFMFTIDTKLPEWFSRYMSEMSRFSCVEVPDREYLHITVKQAGFFVEWPTEESEVSKDAIEQIVAQASRKLGSIEPFEIKLSKLNLFSSVVFFEVEDSGRFQRLHDSLYDIPEIPEFRNDADSYTPHVTVGSLRPDSDFQELVYWLEANRRLPEPVELTVDCISLVKSSPKGPLPEFEIVEEFELTD